MKGYADMMAGRMKPADTDLRNVYEHIAFELQSPENTSGQLNRPEEKFMSLEQMPERYHKNKKLTHREVSLCVSFLYHRIKLIRKF